MNTSWLSTAALCCIALASCSSEQESRVQEVVDEEPAMEKSHVREMVDEDTFLLREISDEGEYGYTEWSPIHVGGFATEGFLNEHRYLNALAGPDGQELLYWRMYSCCQFNTKNSELGTGLLDAYAITRAGSTDTLTMYINLYDSEEELLALKGLTIKK